MLREKGKFSSKLMMLFDLAAIVISFFTAYHLRANFYRYYKLDLFPSKPVLAPAVAGLQDYLPVLFLCAFLWILVLFLNGMYRFFDTYSFSKIVGIVLRSALLTLLIFGAVTFILEVRFISRMFTVMFFGLASAIILLEKWACFLTLRYLRQLGYNVRRVLVVGTGRRAGRFVESIRRHPEWGLNIVGLIDDEEDKVGSKMSGINIIGTLRDIPDVLKKKTVDEAVFIVPRRWLDRVQESITACELQGIRAHLAADLFSLDIADISQTDLFGYPFLSFEIEIGREWQLFVKRLVDVVVSFLGLLLLSPLFLVTAVLVKTASKGPVFFRQKRTSVNGRVFVLYKFRTMHAGAESKRNQLLDRNEMDGPVFKIKDDPRITPLGRFLRRSSIDELPQLFNILKGDMSLVGPRPLPIREARKFEHWQRRRLSMRPGITCLWQVSGRNLIGFDKWMELDLEYIDNWSLWLDVKILLKTVPVVLFGIGAR